MRTVRELAFCLKDRSAIACSSPRNVSSVTSTESIHFLVCHPNPSAPLQTRRLLARQAFLCILHARAARGPAAASSKSAIGVDLQMSFTMLFAIWSRHSTDGCCQNPHACVFSGRPRGKLPGAIVDCQMEHQSEIVRTDTILNNISLSQEFRISQTPRYDQCDKMPSPTMLIRAFPASFVWDSSITMPQLRKVNQ